MQREVEELCAAGALQRALDRYAAAAGRGHVAVALAAGPVISTASVLGPHDRPAPIGCLAKLLTATLVAAGAKRGVLTLDAPVGDLLDVASDALRGVTIKHLLEHTHGLDDSLLEAPRHVRGFIDGGELLARLATLVRWAPPGAVYSYGNGGAWLLAALLERLHGRSFAALVRDELLAPIGIVGARSGADAPLCAALGAGLALTAAELVRFGLHALERTGSAADARVVPLPGWHPLERGVCLGFKSAGAGWLGHQSVWPRASSYLRVHAQRKLALAVVAREQAAALAALAVFGEYFAELFDGRRRLPPAARELLPGVYAQAARVVSVASTPRGLVAEAWERDAHGTQRGTRTSAALVPAGGVLFAQPGGELVPYLEVVAGEPSAAWLWNGRAVLRRVG